MELEKGSLWELLLWLAWVRILAASRDIHFILRGTSISKGIMCKCTQEQEQTYNSTTSVDLI